jgi:hypothetical protein
MLIVEHGSKWAGEESDSLGMLLERLEQYALCPLHFDGESIFDRAHASKQVRYEGGDKYIDLGPMYPEAPYAVIFCGNFAELSAGFHVVTDDAEVIEVLLAAIQSNLASGLYQKALADFREWKTRRAVLNSRTMNAA